MSCEGALFARVEGLLGVGVDVLIEEALVGGRVTAEVAHVRFQLLLPEALVPQVDVLQELAFRDGRETAAVIALEVVRRRHVLLGVEGVVGRKVAPARSDR